MQRTSTVQDLNQESYIGGSEVAEGEMETEMEAGRCRREPTRKRGCWLYRLLFEDRKTVSKMCRNVTV
jgi:hypothetical protein